MTKNEIRNYRLLTIQCKCYRQLQYPGEWEGV